MKNSMEQFRSAGKPTLVSHPKGGGLAQVVFGFQIFFVLSTYRDYSPSSGERDSQL
jgi:hypothetical protein